MPAPPPLPPFARATGSDPRPMGLELHRSEAALAPRQARSPSSSALLSPPRSRAADGAAAPSPALPPPLRAAATSPRHGLHLVGLKLQLREAARPWRRSIGLPLSPWMLKRKKQQQAQQRQVVARLLRWGEGLLGSGGGAPPRFPIGGSEGHAGGIGYPNPPEAAIPGAAILRDQWRFAVRQYSRWYSHAWGTAILAGAIFFALGWLVKGSNPLPSRAEPQDNNANAVSKEER